MYWGDSDGDPVALVAFIIVFMVLDAHTNLSGALDFVVSVGAFCAVSWFFRSL